MFLLWVIKLPIQHPTFNNSYVWPSIDVNDVIVLGGGHRGARCHGSEHLLYTSLYRGCYFKPCSHGILRDGTASNNFPCCKFPFPSANLSSVMTPPYFIMRYTAELCEPIRVNSWRLDTFVFASIPSARSHKRAFASRCSLIFPGEHWTAKHLTSWGL